MLCLSTNNKECVKAGEEVQKSFVQLRLEGATFAMLTPFPRANELFDDADGQMSGSDASGNKFVAPQFQKSLAGCQK